MMNLATHRTARRALTALVAAAALIAPAQAGAATASLATTTLNVNGGGEASDITVTISGGSFVIADPTADVSAGSGCTQNTDTPKKVTCPTAGVTTLGSVLGTGDDKLDTSAVALDTNVNSGSGNDKVTTGAGNDALNGDVDDDALDGGPGTDSLTGGGGGDTLVYTSHTAPVVVHLGTDQQSVQTANNGQAGENDMVIGFEYVLGGSGNDTLTGDGNDNFISGGLGSDTLGGGGGTGDYVGYWERAADVTVQLGQGGPGSGGATSGGENDVIGTDFENAMGGAGDDVVIGNASANVLWGGWSSGTAGPDGDDVLRGMGGADTLWGDLGNDLADYSDKTGGITASLDGTDNDPDGDSIYTDVEGLAGGSGNDTLTGNGSANVLRGGAGADSLNGLGGVDTADYSERSTDVTVTLDGIANDAGELDNVKVDVENVTGGSGNDTLTGNSAANGLSGGPGNDTLNGSGGNDTLNGAGGDDNLRGGLGTDALNGAAGSDTADYSDKAAAVNVSLDGVANDPDGDTIAADVENATGGSGADTLTGSAGTNVLSGGLGDDTFAARDGAFDSIVCGGGTDSGEVDADDALSGDCEATVARPAVEPPAPDLTPETQPPATEPVAPQPPIVQPPVDDITGDDEPVERPSEEKAPIKVTTPTAMNITPAGDLNIGVACTAASGNCKGAIELYELNGTLKARTVVNSARRRKTAKKGTLLGRRNFSVRAGRKKNVRLRLERRGRQRIIKKKGRKKTRGKLVITVTAPDGTKTTTEKNVTIGPPKARRGSTRGRSGGKKKAVAR